MTHSGGLFDIEAKQEAINKMEEQTCAAGFWDDREAAQALVDKLNRRREVVKSYENAQNACDEAEAALELALEDDSFLKEAEHAAAAFEKLLEELELSQMLSGEYDSHDAILAIHAGAGGLEAQDWAEMLLRMFTRWAERHHYKAELIDCLPADEGGMKSATLSVTGANAYGYLKSERGVHRLVRISPFDAQGRRHTSFASVDVLPQVADDNEIVIPAEEMRIDTYRSSGKGGQHLNKTDSAVRITHLPTGIVVSSQTQRSQFQNRDNCWKMLRARLYEMEMQKKADAAQLARDNQGDNGWGYQIRSYVLQPYRLVKDLRTEAETSDCKAVLDGEIDLFLSAALAQKIKDENPTT